MFVPWKLWACSWLQKQCYFLPLFMSDSWRPGCWAADQLSCIIPYCLCPSFTPVSLTLWCDLKCPSLPFEIASSCQHLELLSARWLNMCYETSWFYHFQYPLLLRSIISEDLSILLDCFYNFRFFYLRSFSKTHRLSRELILCSL